MKIITRHVRASGAAKNWRIQYPLGSDYDNDHFNGIYEALVALGPTPDPDDVDRIVGNESWTECYCSHCHTPKGPFIRFNDEYDLCKDCLTAGLNMFILEVA